MKPLRIILSATLASACTPVLAHVGPHDLQQHFIEHLLIALAIGLLVGLGVRFLFKRGGKRV